MDIQIVRRALKKLREEHYSEVSDFAKASTIRYANIKPIEMDGGEGLPSLVNLEKWVRTCGLKLSEFFLAIESGEMPEGEPPLVLLARELTEKNPVAAAVLTQAMQGVLKPPPKLRKPHQRRKA